MNISAIVLAAGKGTRMGSDKPKVLHEIGGRPMIEYTIEKLEQLGVLEIILVVGHGASEVKACIDPKCHYAHQENPLGTGDAVKVGLQEVNDVSDTVMVLYGDDSAFYKVETLKAFLAFHINSGNLISDITADKPQTENVGRVIRDKDGNFKEIMEVWEYKESGLHSDEVNCGVYLFNKEWLKKNIGKIKNENEKKEYRITDVLNMADKSVKIGLFKLEDPSEWVGVNTPEELVKANKLMEAA